jgi:hypothetical protein
MDKVQYRKSLVEQMLPSAEELYPEGGWMFQEGNDPERTANMMKQRFEGNGVPVLEWPSKSPDLSHIENLWSILEANLKDTK